MSDYISREALLDRLNKNLSACNPGTFSEMCYADAIETVKHFPAADVEPVRHWIPRSERMPEVDDYYLCAHHFDGHKKKRITTFFCYATDPNPHFQYENHYGLKITHWMPLPELPEEE